MCRSRRELSNEYLLAKIGVDTAENEPLEVWLKIIQYYSFVSLSVYLRGWLQTPRWLQAAAWLFACLHCCVRLKILPAIVEASWTTSSIPEVEFRTCKERWPSTGCRYKRRSDLADCHLRGSRELQSFISHICKDESGSQIRSKFKQWILTVGSRKEFACSTQSRVLDNICQIKIAVIVFCYSR